MTMLLTKTERHALRFEPDTPKCSASGAARKIVATTNFPELALPHAVSRQRPPEERQMQVKTILAAVIAAIILSAPGASAQTTPTQNPAAQNPSQPATSDGPDATQSAPAESPQASGHDAQSGQPETGPNAAKTQGAASDGYKAIHDDSGKK